MMSFMASLGLSPVKTQQLEGRKIETKDKKIAVSTIELILHLFNLDIMTQLRF